MTLAGGDCETDAGPSVHTSTVRKLDFILLPFLSILFLVNSLDRSNIGNAETAHFTRDAGLQPEDLNAAVAWFFVFFVALQPVGAAAGRKFGMSRWVPSVMTLWGVCTLLHIWVRRRWQLIMLRIILGTLEAGFYPTAVSYLSLFYTRFEFGRRLGLFYGSYGVAGALGGILAFFVFSRFPPSEEPIDGESIISSVPETLKPWQILFLVEGCLTVVIAIIGFFWLPRSVGSAWFLNKEERAWAKKRILIDRGDTDCQRQGSINSITLSDELPEEETLTQPDDVQRLRLLPENDNTKKKPRGTSNFSSDAGLSRSELLSTVLFLPLMFPILLLNIASAIPNTGFSVFLPLVLSSLQLSSPTLSNLLTAPPFLLASIFLYLFSHWSDKSRKRIIPILASLMVIALGLILTVVLSSSSSSSTPLSPTRAVAIYFALCVLLSGSYIPSPLTVTWLASNIPNPGKRTIILGINGYGNLAGVFASLIFSPRFQQDSYRVPFLITLGFVLLSFVGFVALWVVLRVINTARSRSTAVLRVADIDAESDYLGSGRSWGLGGSRKVPAFAVVGGSWWDSRVRYWFGGKVLGMDGDDFRVRRGDEMLTFQYGL
ncbi:hypothetical protein ACJ72_05567 [Emergomyces africanus]|uniref:Major facilitator superfamily (MFS) profile domain-containing protein n=1 Tax=Emergomyces africanus TaxID=1955775 RepID=A0A1B7NTK9_9EURO|nr:hypothetical protein ACJ72_05567 [Emergomyces africanus]